MQDQEEIKREEKNQFDISMLRGVPIGYTPLPTNVPGEPEGSLWLANFFNNTTIGSFIASPQSKALSGEIDRELNFIDHIPEDLILGYADRYVGRNVEDFDEITAHIRAEQERKALIDAHPWQSLAINMVEGVIDPASWLPLGALYKNVKHGTNLARSIVGSGAAGVIGASVSEAIIQRNQLTREAEESYNAIATSGILSAALGGLGYGLRGRITTQMKETFESRTRMHNEVLDTLNGTPKKLNEHGILDKEDLVNIPQPLRKAMEITPMNRLLNSPFNTSKWFANVMYQKNFQIEKHIDLQTDGAAVESLIRLDMSKSRSTLIKYQDHYFDMVGIGKGPFRGTRAKLAGVDMSFDDFNKAVWLRLSTQVDHERPAVNNAARLIEEEIIKPTRQKAIELGLLDENQWPVNSNGYIVQAYQKDKIIEQGGKKARGEGTFPQFLFNKFKAAQLVTKDYLTSPRVVETKARIDTLKKKLKTSVGKNKKTLKQEIQKLEKQILDEAPRQAKNWEGKLHSIIDDDKTLWTQVEQTVDNILGDSDGALINPILQKIRSGTPKPLNSRKLTIPQEELMEWSVTDVPRLMDMYSRAMHPMIRLTELARKNGAKDISEFREMLSDMIKKEFEQLSEGKLGKAAQDLRKKRDCAISDMNATFDLLMGVYGDGPNVLNTSAQQRYQNFLKWNYVRLLGYMTISSMADAGAQVFVHGPYRFIHDGLIQAFSGAAKISRRDLRAIGYAMETELGTRIHSWVEHQGLSTNPGPFTKGLDVLTQKFGNLSLMNQWNTLQQSIAGHVGINRTLDTIHKFVEGRPVAKKDLERLVRNGLGKEHWETIYKFTKDNKADNGTLYADWTNWDIKTKAEREALEQFQSSIAQEIDSIVIVPGLGDKPLLAQTPVGKFLFQFKSFAMAATNKLLYSGIQRRTDINVYLGAITMLSLGAASYVTSSLLKGKEPDLSFKNLSWEALDRSGLIGIYSEGINIGSKFLGFGGTTRYQTRDFFGAAAGPGFGALSELYSVAGKTSQTLIGEEDFTTADAYKFQRLQPLQNLFYLERVNKYLYRNTALGLGARDAG